MTTYQCPDCGNTDLRVTLPRVHVFTKMVPQLIIADRTRTTKDITTNARMLCAGTCGHSGPAWEFRKVELDTAIGLLRALADPGTYVNSRLLDRIRTFVAEADKPPSG